MDKLGNRDQVHTRDGNNIDYVIDDLTNRYDKVGNNTLTYDVAGNLKKDKADYTYYYDYENRLIKIKKSNDTITVAEFSYDALGRRIEKKDSITSTNTRRYYYNYNWQVLSEYDGSNNYKRSYVYGNYIDEVLMSFWVYSTAQCKYYLHDHLYSPVAVTNYLGQTAERYEYDAYGKCYILEPNFAPDPDGKSDVGNPYYFTGREMDTLDNGSLKIMNYRHRYYDTYTGRFSTHDPLGITPNTSKPNQFRPIGQYKDGLSTYEYVKNNPVVYLDPWGLSEESCSFAVYDPVEPPEPDYIPVYEPYKNAYDWWNPLTPSGIKCEKPCKWHNKGDTTHDYREAGCYTAEISLPTESPGGILGTVISILGIYWEVASPTVTLCNGFIVEGETCQCTLRLKRKCEQKCCDQYVGVFTRKKKVGKVLVKYGKGEYWLGSGPLQCSCNPWKTWIYLSPGKMSAEVNKVLNCEK